MIVDFLTPETIRVRAKAKDWEEVVEEAGHLLVAVEGVEERYVDAMKEMIRSIGAYMVIVPGFALLHARPEDGARRECMSLVTLAEPIEFGHPENDPVHFVIAFATADKDRHLTALAELAKMLQDDSRMRAIREATTVSDVLSAISMNKSDAGGTSE